MKRITLLLILLLPLMGLSATELESDVVFINGEEWQLLHRPMRSLQPLDSVLYQQFDNLVSNGKQLYSTNNPCGYRCYWTFENNRLYLQKVVSMAQDTVFTAKDLKTLFKPFYGSKGIRADWLDGDVRVGKGEVVWMGHLGFSRRLEEECILTFQKGKVVHKEVKHNYLKDGFYFSNEFNEPNREAIEEISRRFPFQQFPELEHCQRILVSIKDFFVTSDGHFESCKISALYRRGRGEANSTVKIEDQDHPLIVAMKEVMASIYPWRVTCIDGQCWGNYETYTLSFFLPDKKPVETK